MSIFNHIWCQTRWVRNTRAYIWLNFFLIKPQHSLKLFISTSPQHYNMVMAAAAAASASASASEDHELLLNRFMPYGSSQLFLEQSGTPASSSLVPANGSGGSSSGSSSSLVSSSSLRDSHPHSNVSRSRSDAAASVIYGSIPDVISLDWPRRGPTNGQAFITNNRRTLKELCALVIGFRCEWDGRWGEKKRTKTFVKRRIKLLCTEKKNLFSVLLLYINNRTLPTQWVTSVGIFSMDTEDVFHCSVCCSLSILFCTFYTFCYFISLPIIISVKVIEWQSSLSFYFLRLFPSAIVWSAREHQVI